MSRQGGVGPGCRGPEHAAEGEAAGASLFYNGPIYPMNGPRLDGGVLLARGSLIEYVGPKEGLDPGLRAGAELIDLDGRPLLPGLCDCHLHLVLSALELAALDLHGLSSIEELRERLREKSAQVPPGEWIVGRGWERRLLLVEQRPSIGILDGATTEHPVFLASKDLHSAWMNSAGLDRLLSLERLPGKCVIHEMDGAPTGLVFEDILSLRRQLVPQASETDKERLLGPMVRQLWACGITAVHSNETPEDFEIIRCAAARSPHRVRVLANLIFDSPEELRQGAGLFAESVPGWLCTGGAKLFLDGSFGTLTAAVSHPYTGTDDCGILNMDMPELMRWLEAIHHAAVPAVMHAIGDRAVEQALHGLGRLTWPPGTRHRIEHAQLLSDRIVHAYDLRGLVFSGQPSHMWGDRDIVQRMLQDQGARRWAYPYRSMQDLGSLVLFGSDAPVEDADPWKGIQAAITRLEHGGSPPWIGEERISLEDALAAHSSRPARLHGHCFETGMLEPGRLADLVVLDRDPFALARSDPSCLRGRIHADQTWLGGLRVYARAEQGGGPQT